MEKPDPRAETPQQHPLHLLEEYTPPPWLVETTELDFVLDVATVTVRARLTLRRNGAGDAPLELDAECPVRSVSVNGVLLPYSAWSVEDGRLVIPSPPESLVLETETILDPAANTALEGLYLSDGILCTQCESEGFRRITPFPDRPDVTSLFTVRIEADRQQWPVLLSNGNELERGELPGGRHYSRWHDPFRKPCYLFALVAGDLQASEDSFITASGRTVSLQVWVKEKELHRTRHALECLRQAMRWDEEVFGLEYDLDRFMIVAVDHFNAGAMENKGLNIFNSALLFADAETATDDDYQAILRVIAHEYFHNWTGNRVTLRDWFQLCLKEGLTIFRDEEFSADVGSRPVRRIADVRILRQTQFPEDSGPLAHPVRPGAYREISNFYTMTVYRKGAELFRMIRTLLGPERFRAGIDLYFRRHDGGAATVEEFVAAMEDATAADLRQFLRWFLQAGRPTLTVRGSHDPATATFTLRVRQETPPTPGEPRKQTLHIPLAMGLLDADGAPLPLLLQGEEGPGTETKILEIRREEETFRFTGIPREPVPSLLRNFSAPVTVDYPYREEELLLLTAHDTDPFARWEATQRLAEGTILRLAEDPGVSISPLVAALGGALRGGDDRDYVAELLSLPGEKRLAELMPVVDPVALHNGREILIRRIASTLRDLLRETFHALATTSPYAPGDGREGARRLRNLALGFLTAEGEPEMVSLALKQFREADNMTERLGGIAALARLDVPERGVALREMYDRWRDNPQVMEKWLVLQATSPLPGALDEVERLLEHPVFDRKNPNRVRALIAAFCGENHLRFHAPSGRGYRFLADQVLLTDKLNPQLAARLLPPLCRWQRYDAGRGGLMRRELLRLSATAGISREVSEMAHRGLEEAPASGSGAASSGSTTA